MEKPKPEPSGALYQMRLFSCRLPRVRSHLIICTMSLKRRNISVERATLRFSKLPQKLTNDKLNILIIV